MAQLAIDKDFLQDYAALERPVQAKIGEVFSKFETATHTGLHLEPVHNARDPRFHTIRINQFWRGVVLAPDKGEVYTLLKVLPHDKAYEWAQRRKASVNGATGRIEIRDVAAIDATLPALSQMAQQAPTRLFDRVNDADLRRLGLDEQTLAFARVLTAEIQLAAAKGFLPERQWDVLAGLQAGMSVEEIWAELGSRPEALDVENIDEAVSRSTDRVVLVDGPIELLAVLGQPFALWRVYLHPTQQRVVDATYNGPARVTGGPGTGKTVVALHRAQRLAQKLIQRGLPADQSRVLLPTFTSTLTHSLHAGLLLLTDDADVLRRVDVLTVDQIARRILTERRGAPRLIDEDAQRALWRRAAQENASEFTESFLADEWRQVVLAQDIGTLDAYLAASRAGRGRPVGAAQRARIWPAITAFTEELTRRNLWTYETVCAEATRLLRQEPSRLYRHVVVDEAQDLSLPQWRLLRALVPAGPNDLFIAGDAHQRIYRHQVALHQVGIPTTGRSSRLTVNYRTTAEILAWSLGMLREEAIDDLDAGLERIAGYRSPLHGRPPVLTGYRTRAAELTGLGRMVRGWLDLGIHPDEIGVAARSNALADAAGQALSAAGLPVRLLAKTNQPDDGVSVGTMHRMKGLEFRCMAVICLNDKVLPAAVTPIEEDALSHAQDLLRERCLLFVACTRAREQLSVSWYGTPSPFLSAP